MCEYDLFVRAKVVHACVDCAAVVAIRSMKRKAKDGAAALVGMTPFIALVLLSALWVLWSPSDVLSDHPRLLIWTVGFVFAKVKDQSCC